MTLDEAIKHAEEVAEEQKELYGLCPASESEIFHCDGTKDCKTLKNGENMGCQKCAEEHRQLAEWLKDYKRLLEQEPKQVELEGDGYAYGTDEIVYDFGKCPSCGWIFEDGDKDWKEPYCCHCGQRLKWFDEEAEREDKE